jgi:hypothetical protein
MFLNYRSDCVIQGSTDALSENHTLHQYTKQM